MRSFSINILFDFENSKIVKTLFKAIEPDNKIVPKDIIIKTVQKGCNLKINIIVISKLETLQATIDDLIFCLQVAYQTLILLINSE